MRSSSPSPVTTPISTSQRTITSEEANNIQHYGSDSFTHIDTDFTPPKENLAESSSPRSDQMNGKSSGNYSYVEDVHLEEW